MEFTNPFDADEFVQDHVCASCWGQLVKIRKDAWTWGVACENCGDKETSFISRKTMKRRADASAEELASAKQALRDAIPWLKSKKTANEILKELGF